MNLSKIRRWANNQTDIISTNGLPLTEIQLLDTAFRRQNRIMLATSCFDKEGKELYEADVIRMYYPTFDGLDDSIRLSSDELPVYGYIDYYTTIKDFGVLSTYGHSLIELKSHNKTFEVVGNFYENPEFLHVSGGAFLKGKWSL